MTSQKADPQLGAAEGQNQEPEEHSTSSNSTGFTRDKLPEYSASRRRETLQFHALQFIAIGFELLVNRDDVNHAGDDWNGRDALTIQSVSKEVYPNCVLWSRGGKTPDELTLLGIDLDTAPERTAALDRILGWQTMADGRPGRPVSHVFLKCPDVPKDFTVENTGHIEIRVRGGLTRMAPSVYKDGMEYLALLPDRGFDALREVPWAEIVQRVNHARAINALADGWEVGQRHKLVLWAAGWLMKDGWEPEEVEQLIRDIIDVVGEPEDWDKDIATALDGTAERLEKGEPVAGYSRLAEMYGAELPKIAGWLNIDASERKPLSDFVALGPANKYIDVTNNEIWLPASIDKVMGKVVIGTDKAGGKLYQAASTYLLRHSRVDQLTWAPGLPPLIEDLVMLDGEMRPQAGNRIYNLYRAPLPSTGNPADVGPWLDHLRTLFPRDEEVKHIINWLAHRVQRPGEKINHALVLAGAPGIGKDTILVPVRRAIGEGNFQEIGPAQLMERFNQWAAAVIVRVSEAHDLGEISRFSFYERTKIYQASPPELLRCEQKYLNPYYVPNVMGMIITSNYREEGLYLNKDDRRHWVGWSDKEETDFDEEYWTQLYDWFAAGGIENVAAYLATRDLSRFNPKAPPPMTAAKLAMIAANTTAEDSELGDVLEEMDNPEAVTVRQIAVAANGGDPWVVEQAEYFKARLSVWLTERKNAGMVPARMRKVGYERVANKYAGDGRWKVRGTKETVYARRELTDRDRYEAAE
jgi:hypothetical protein